MIFYAVIYDILQLILTQSAIGLTNKPFLIVMETRCYSIYFALVLVSLALLKM